MVVVQTTWLPCSTHYTDPLYHTVPGCQAHVSSIEYSPTNGVASSTRYVDHAVVLSLLRIRIFAAIQQHAYADNWLPAAKLYSAMCSICCRHHRNLYVTSQCSKSLHPSPPSADFLQSLQVLIEDYLKSRTSGWISITYSCGKRRIYSGWPIKGPISL